MWIKCSERLPPSNKKVIILLKDGAQHIASFCNCPAHKFWSVETACICPFDIEREDVTHWMPLPEAPKEDE